VVERFHTKALCSNNGYAIINHSHGEVVLLNRFFDEFKVTFAELNNQNIERLWQNYSSWLMLL